jgi:hemerythrin superfamily protein
LGSTLDTRHSDTNFTFAVHDARVHIETPREIAEPFTSKINRQHNFFGGKIKMDALELLKTDHKKVKELFKKAEGNENQKQQKQLFEQIKTELETHTHIEETVFYPAVAKHEELKDMVLESLEEHKQVKTLLREMENLSSDSEKFDPKLKVLMENVEHHAEEEEEGKMFPKVRKLMNAKALDQLGQELEAAKHKEARKAG